MAAKKPTGKAPAVEFSSATPEKKKRGPRTGTKNQPLAAPIMDDPDNAAKLKEAYGKAEAALPEGWTDLEAPKEQSATEEIETKAPNVEFTPGDLARKYSMITRNRSTGAVDPEAKARIERVKAYQQKFYPSTTVFPGTPATAVRQEQPGVVMGRTSTPQTEWAAAKARYESAKANLENFRNTSGLQPGQRLVPGESSASKPEAKEPMRVAKSQQKFRQTVIPILKTLKRMPHRNETSVSPNGTVTVTPILRGPSGEVQSEEAKTFAPNQNNISADEYRIADGGHIVDGQHIAAYTKHTVQYRRTNNNGVIGVVPAGETQHEGTFYRHPETGEIVQTMDKPVAPTYSAVQLHHANLYRMYGHADARNRIGSSSAAARNELAGGTTSYNWAKESLAKAIQSSRGGDVAGTMKELEQNPDAIKDLFHDHFVVGPQKEKAYKKAAKAGSVPLIDEPHKLEKKKTNLLKAVNEPGVFRGFN